MIRLDQETDIAILRQAALQLERENQRLVAKIVELTRELQRLKGKDPTELRLQIEKLEQQLAQRNHRLFGDFSEKRPNDQQPKRGEEEAPKPPQKGHGPRKQPKLPVVEQVHGLDDADRICPCCGGGLEAWEGQFEDSEEVDVVERHFVLKKHRRQKYRCRCNGCIETAPGPLKLCEGARYSVDFAIEVAVNKYLDHLPLERQVRIMNREGLEVDSQTLWDQIERGARMLTPAYEALQRRVLAEPIVGADETRWRLLGAKGNDEGEATRWQVWAVAAPRAVVYQIRDSRSTDEAEAVLRGFMGVVMCDGDGAYKAMAKNNPALTLAHCWAHVRREFVEIAATYPKETTEVLDRIGELYQIEALCPAGPAGDALRAELRSTRSRAIVDRIKDWANATPTLGESSLGKAIGYMAGIWSGLVRFLEDPRIPIDNNATERARRGVVVGRKNHDGSRSRRGTEVAALFYSLLESAKLAGEEPKAYLRRALFAALRGKPIPLPGDAV
jgi:transposase